MECLNCGHPLTGNEKYCPECGQKNKGSKITFGSFIREVFNGFISFDGKFWTTLIPLIIKPGKVSRDFIDGKRARYTNPFQFYISVSIIFFLILGAANKYQELQDFNGNESSGFTLINFDPGINNTNDSIPNGTNVDSILNNIVIPEGIQLDSVEKAVANQTLDSIKRNVSRFNNDELDELNELIDSVGFGGKFQKMRRFQRKYPKSGANQALDSLQIDKTFWNRFVYSMAGKVNAFANNTSEENKKLSKELISYASVAIFVFLPIFTLFLRFIYIRRKFTYVEHLIFVFHTQTVFFILTTLFFLLWLYTVNTDIIAISMILFMIYLFIAMKRFYKQGFFKTLFKYMIINLIFLVLGGIGFAIVSLIAFAIY